MNRGLILIVNLAKGKLGEAPTHLLGAFLATAIAQAAEARAVIPEHERRDFHLVVDEFQNFATESFSSILSESRKWRLRLTSSHQFLGQLSDGLRQSVLANTGSLIAFRCGAEDAEALAADFGIQNPQALSDTANFTAWAKLMQNGIPGDPVLIETSYPEPLHRGQAAAVVSRTRARYTRPRMLVEANINRVLGIV